MNINTKRATLDKVEQQDYDVIRITVADESTVLSWSYGEVLKPETINYRTFKPEKDGLFCARIFGPIKDYECLCGKYKRTKFKGIVCEKCGVEVTSSKVRRDRMGHIELAVPVAHVWFAKSLPSRIGALLDLNLKDLERVIYYESFIVIDPGLTNLKKSQILSEDEYNKAQDEFGQDAFYADMGGIALKELLKKINPEEEIVKLTDEIQEVTSEVRRKKIQKRLAMFEVFKRSGVKPSSLVLSILPVLPPELRPLVALEGGRFASSDLNDLYRRVINRNNRLKRLTELYAPEIIIRNERRMLQESVDALFDNGRRNRAILGSNKRPLKSLSDMLKGKQGRFRQNLLGKRVDYSGRSVIVVGPDLKLNQCGIPKRMALELLRPFVYSRLVKLGLTATLKTAKQMVEREVTEVWDTLETVIRQHPVLLNRAPTLHRLGIQAFEPKLVEGKAIHLHPLVCTAFNADFDGDQMAVHVPLSIEARLEARILMMSSNNILSPSSGKPIIIPTKDIVLGLYYLTALRQGLKGEDRVIGSQVEMEYLLLNGEIELHSKIKARMPYYAKDGKAEYRIIETTPGRMIFSAVMPKHHQLPFDIINKVLTSSDVSELVNRIFRVVGQKACIEFVDRIMKLGFEYMTKSGVSFSKDDLIIPEEKKSYIQETKELVGEYEQQFLDGLITQGEKYNKVIDAWDKCADSIAKQMMIAMSKVNNNNEMNSVYMMAHSKARGSTAQMRQLAGMRGLMAKPSGDIIETPIISNFKEGLNVFEYFSSTHGARKGLADSALKTANSGYLTRRLVDVAQDCVITEQDCGTTNGISVKAVVESGNTIVMLSERILGRCAADDLVDPKTGDIVVKHGHMINESDIEKIEDYGVNTVKIRSVLTCESKNGICSRCYGRDLGRGQLVNVGEAVGIVAAQSIGEPGTQLTLRTFHIGGAAQKGSEISSVEANYDGTIKLSNAKVVKSRAGAYVVLSRACEMAIIDSSGNEVMKSRISYGAELYFKDGDKVKKGDRIAKWDAYSYPIVAEYDGKVEYVDLYEGRTMNEFVDEATGASSRVVLDWKQSPGTADLRPLLKLLTKDEKAMRYYLAPNAIVSIGNNMDVKAGDIIAKVPKETVKTRDITGGLPRVSELFEARRPKDPAVIAEFNGTVEFGKDYKTKRRLSIISEEDPEMRMEYMIAKGRFVTVNDGDYVKKGDLIVDGNPVPHDILRILGIETLASYLVDEVQQVYRVQGVPINDKHIETIVRQMLRKFEILDAGDSEFKPGDEIERSDLILLNEKLETEGKKPVIARAVLQGITKASLHTKSFMSAASFQETTRVLTESAIAGRIDPLLGLKENVIVGRLIPAGTGHIMRKYKAMDPDKTKGEDIPGLLKTIATS
ncbi:MAG: DNA-directed RNA polymerase subunit beta' [Alphaproteobacteria bacterium]|nr:MAG: DNA-directed RNA polymerase subunit beta' [Alphaproteobacteria bacterium]